MAKKSLTFAIMDAPYENGRSTTALRLIDAALRHGFDVNVFAYEGAVGIASSKQTQHPNAVHGRDAAQEDHPNPSIIETAYRGTLEEQDDTIVWLTHAMKGAGADLTVVLRGNAVTYAGRGQDASGLAFGERRQANSPRIDEDVAKLAAKGVEVFVVEDDLATRGVEPAELIEGVKLLPSSGLAKLFGSYDQVWHW